MEHKIKRAVLLAGGFGTRISEESQFKPKPMVEIGGKPILWHIMKQLYHQGINEFIICAGYKQEYIKNWFIQYSAYQSDVTLDFKNSTTPYYFNNKLENWKVTIIDTGYNTNTGGRLQLVEPYLNNEDFLYLCQQTKHLEVQVDNTRYQTEACYPLVHLRQTLLNSLCSVVKVDSEYRRCKSHAENCEHDADRTVVYLDYGGYE